MKTILIFVLAIACIRADFIELRRGFVNEIRGLDRRVVPSGKPLIELTPNSKKSQYLIAKMMRTIPNLSSKQISNARLILSESSRFTTSGKVMAYLLATAYVESNLIPSEEKLSDNPRIRKVQQHYFDIGYQGRGYIHFSGPTTYTRMLNELLAAGEKRVEPKDLLEPRIAAKVLVIGAMKGLFTGCSIIQCLSPANDFNNARRAFNGENRAVEIQQLAEKITGDYTDSD